MTISERIQLHKLGYSKEEINTLAAEGYDPKGLTEPPQEPAPQEPAPQEPAPQEPAPQEPAPQEPTPQEPAPQDDRLDTIAKSLDALTKAFQMSNLQQSQQPQKKETVDDVFNAIYNN